MDGMTDYPVPGRGAWTLTGGLLRKTPDSTSSIGYYRLAAGTEKPVGSGWYKQTDTSHHAHAVFLGVGAIQELVKVAPDGWFGPGTEAAVRSLQSAWSQPVTGRVGPTFMKTALTPLVADIASNCAVPVAILGGIAARESGLDPAAVGTNGYDTGLCQINLDPDVHGADVRLEEALSPEFALHWTGQELRHTHDVWASKVAGGVDPWDVAIAAHNSPALAKQWAQTGKPPVVVGRQFQIADYVSGVRSAW